MSFYCLSIYKGVYSLRNLNAYDILKTLGCRIELKINLSLKYKLSTLSFYLHLLVFVHINYYQVRLYFLSYLISQIYFISMPKLLLSHIHCVLLDCHSDCYFEPVIKQFINLFTSLISIRIISLPKKSQ